MKKLVNIRLPILFACALTVGVGAGFLLFTKNIEPIWIIATVPPSAIIFIILCVFNKKKGAAVTVIFCVFIIAGAVNCYYRLNNFNTAKLADGETYTFTATVYEKGETDYGGYIMLINARTGGVKVDGKIRAYLGKTYGDFCECGYEVTFTARISAVRAVEYGKLNTYAEDNVKYTCSVNSGLEAKRRFSLFGSVRSAIKDTLFNNIDKDTAAVAYAMLTGNTQDMDEGVSESFRYGGVAHIFAVSGLHISLIYGILSFVLKRLRINKFAAAGVCIAAVLFYAGICGFTLSSVRALIMCAVAATAKLSYKKYDATNALSLAVILILLVTPLSLFSVGFQLSVCAVAGILFLKLPRRFPKFIQVPLAAQAGILPIMLINFGYLSGAGLLMNILVLPLLSVIFVITFKSVILCTALPVVSAFLLPSAILPLETVISFFVSFGFEKSLISGFGAGLFVPFYYIGLFALSDKLNMRALYRLSAAACAVLVLAVYVILKSAYPFDGVKVTVTGYYGGGCVLIKSHGESVLIVTENINNSRLKVFLNRYYSTDLSAVILLGGENIVAEADGLFGCDTYAYGGYVYLQKYTGGKVIYENSFSASGIDFCFSDGYSLKVLCSGVDIAVCAGSYVPFDSCTLLVADCAEYDCDCNYEVAFNERSVEYNSYICGDLKFTLSNGNIKMN